MIMIYYIFFKSVLLILGYIGKKLQFSSMLGFYTVMVCYRTQQFAFTRIFAVYFGVNLKQYPVWLATTASSLILSESSTLRCRPRPVYNCRPVICSAPNVCMEQRFSTSRCLLCSGKHSFWNVGTNTHIDRINLLNKAQAIWFYVNRSLRLAPRGESLENPPCKRFIHLTLYILIFVVKRIKPWRNMFNAFANKRSLLSIVVK